MIDDANLRASLISALVGYLRQDDAGPEVRLLLLARAAGAWWDRLVRQQELDYSYMLLDLDRHPVPPAVRAEHFRRASTAFAAYRDPGAPPADVAPPAGLEDPGRPPNRCSSTSPRCCVQCRHPPPHGRRAQA